MQPPVNSASMAPHVCAVSLCVASPENAQAVTWHSTRLLAGPIC